MSNIIKAFVQLTGMVNNVYGATAKLGEMSAISKTFTTDLTSYESNEFLGYEILVLKSQDSVTGERTSLGPAHVREIMRVVQRIVSYAAANVRPHDPTDFTDAVLAAMGGEIRELRLGEEIDDGVTALPGWVSWESIVSPDTVIKIWLADEALFNQYDEQLIKVVPVLPNLDTLFNQFAVVSQTLDARPSNWLEEGIAIARQNQPETVLRIPSFEMVNLADPSETKLVQMPVLVHGTAGDNVDTIKDAIQEYILAHSQKNRNEWSKLFPSLFRRTEFVFVPNWRAVAVPYFSSSTELSGIYSPIIDPRMFLDLAKSLLVGYATTHIESKIEFMTVLHRSIALAYVPGESNLTQFDRLIKVVPDYALLNSVNVDFNRLSPETRLWINRFQDLVMAAETVTPYSSVPPTIRKIYRGTKLFVSSSIGQVNYLVAAKWNPEFN